MISKKALTLSIVIPVYNEQHHIKACLDSIKNQTIPPKQVIVVDNNCTDDTINIVKQYSFVRIVKQPTQGIVFARNAGFDAVKSELIGRIDADTILPNNGNSVHTDEALTGGGYFYNFRLPRLNGWMFSQLAYRFNRLFIGHYILWGSNMAMPKEMWQAVKDSVCLREEFHEDIDLALHCHKMGYKITYDETLRVGVKLKRVWEDRWQQSAHLNRWPTTLKAHGYSLWWMGSIGNKLLPLVGEPFFVVSEGLARAFGRSKLPK